MYEKMSSRTDNQSPPSLLGSYEGSSPLNTPPPPTFCSKVSFIVRQLISSKYILYKQLFN